MDSELDRRNFWDEQSCAEFEAMLDEREFEEQQEPAGIKKCKRCSEVKSLDEFHAHPRTLDGRMGECKECRNGREKERRKANIEAIRAYDRKRSTEPHRVAAHLAFVKSDRGKEFHNAMKKKWNQNNPRKRAAQLLFRNRQRYDKSLAPQPCIKCGAKAHGHHENYDKPLEVVWLCPFHHKQRHKEMKAQGIEP